MQFINYIFSDTDFVLCCPQDLWIGEADNPGPVDQFGNLEMDSYAPATTSFVRIGCSNAGGLRGKKKFGPSDWGRNLVPV